MFNLNLIQQAIDCRTGEIIPQQQIVEACFTEGRTISLVFADSKIALVDKGNILSSNVDLSVHKSLENFLEKHIAIKDARETIKRLETELGASTNMLDPNTVNLEYLAEDDTVMLRNGLQLKVNILRQMKPGRYTILTAEGGQFGWNVDGTSNQGNYWHDVVQIIKA